MQTDLKTAYAALLAKYKDIAILSSVEGILGWDMMTKMPPKGISLRSQQLALLAGIGHRMATDKEIGRLLKNIEQTKGDNDLTEVQKRNVHLIRKSYLEQTALPEKLVTEIQRQNSIANNKWQQAKAANDWEMFRPELEKNLNLAKQSAEILMQVKKTATPYDALIDIYEPGMTAEKISGLFQELRQGLILLINKIQNSNQHPDNHLLQLKVPVEMQKQIGLALAEAVGYDVSSSKAAGRIDETEHPFTSGYYDDVRITTHYYENMAASSIFSVLHESGHALYEEDLNPEWIYQPVGTGCSMGIHESQSRFVENIVGRSRELWAYFLPKLKQITGNILSDVSPEEMFKAINFVKPSKIRIEADEVTYSLHVIIRFNLEKDLFEGNLDINDLPEAWNRYYRYYLGVDIDNYSEGVMQDMHWSAGNFGYFPCYALGNIYSGQFLAKMNLDISIWRREIEKGNFSIVKDWLSANIHGSGNLYDPGDLIKKVTGNDISVEPYLRYLNEKYGEIYKF